MENYSIKDAFKSLKELDEKEVKLAYIPSLRESIAKDDGKQYLIESEILSTRDKDDMAKAEKMLDDNEDPEKLEQVIDVDANIEADLKKPHVGDGLLQCPRCTTLFYKKVDELEQDEETYTDENGVEKHFYNKGLTCPHCGQDEDGFQLVGQVGAPTLEQPVEEPAPMESGFEPIEEQPAEASAEEPIDNGDQVNPDELFGEDETPVTDAIFKESLKEDIAEDEVCPECKQAGLSTVISDLIKDEWEAIDGYKSSVATFKDQGQDPNVIKVFEDIIAEEMKHVGQLEAALKGIAPESENIEKGNEEGEQQLAGNDIDLPIEEEPVEESLIPTWKIEVNGEFLVDDMGDDMVFDTEEDAREYLEGEDIDGAEVVCSNVDKMKVSKFSESCKLEEEPVEAEAELGEGATFDKLMKAAQGLSEENIEVESDKDELREVNVQDDIEALDDAAKELNIKVKEALTPAQFDFDKDEVVEPENHETQPAKFDFDKDEDAYEDIIDLDDIDEKSLDEQLSKYLKERMETFESYTTTNASLDEDLGKLFVEGCVKENDGSETKAEFEFNVKDFDKANNKLRFTEATEDITLTTSINEKMLVTESLDEARIDARSYWEEEGMLPYDSIIDKALAKLGISSGMYRGFEWNGQGDVGSFAFMDGEGNYVEGYDEIDLDDMLDQLDSLSGLSTSQKVNSMVDFFKEYRNSDFEEDSKTKEPQTKEPQTKVKLDQYMKFIANNDYIKDALDVAAKKLYKNGGWWYTDNNLFFYDNRYNSGGKFNGRNITGKNIAMFIKLINSLDPKDSAEFNGDLICYWVIAVAPETIEDRYSI